MANASIDQKSLPTAASRMLGINIQRLNRRIVRLGLAKMANA